MNISSIINTRKNGDYQRENFDLFLSSIGFRFDIRAIHITGTNGKGSTANYLYSIFKASGLRVGLYLSPYLHDLNETILVNDKHISDIEIKEIIYIYKDQILKYNLSLFEIETFVAFMYFKKSNCNICVIECGMGGQYDATNIITPILSIITSISLEHTEILGRTISEIAEHKGGIIKDNVPLVVGNIDQEATNVLVSICKQHKSKFNKLSEVADSALIDSGYRFSYRIFKDLEISSLAYFSVIDACIAVESIIVLKDIIDISEDSLRKGLREATIPSRFEIISNFPTVVIDGGHNPEAIDLLCESISKKFIDKNIHVIYAAFKDKNITAILPKLSLISNDVVITTFDHPRARKEDDYFIYLDDYRFVNDHVALIKEKINIEKESVLLITGSLAFALLVRDEFKNGYFKN